MRVILSITKALSDQNRVRIICALQQFGELCVCQIQEFLELAPSTTSKHLSILMNAGILEFRKKGRWAYYRINSEDEIPADAHNVIYWLCNQSMTEKTVLADKANLDQILTYSPEELCQRQANGQRCCSSAPETPAEARWQKATQET